MSASGSRPGISSAINLRIRSWLSSSLQFTGPRCRAPAPEAGKHRHLAPRPRVARRAALAQPHIAEHRLLRRRLRLFIAREDRQDERLLRRAPRVTGIERRRQVGDRIELAERLGRVLRVRVASEQVAAQANGRREFAAIASLDAGHGVEPLAAGGRNPSRASRRVSIACLSAGVTPTVPTPCTLLWPRIGMRPACGRPIMPRNNARLAIICTFSTPCR